MVNVDAETLIPFAEAPRVIPGNPDLSQVYRWPTRGLRGVRLERIRVGGKRFASNEALSRFYAALTAADEAAMEAARG